MSLNNCLDKMTKHEKLLKEARENFISSLQEGYPKLNIIFVAKEILHIVDSYHVLEIDFSIRDYAVIEEYRIIIKNKEIPRETNEFYKYLKEIKDSRDVMEKIVDKIKK